MRKSETGPSGGEQSRPPYWGEGARLTEGWTKEQATGAHLRLLYPQGGSNDGTAETHLEIAADAGEYRGEGQRLRSDGSTFSADVTLTALRDSGGKLQGFTNVIHDLSPRRSVEAALTKAAAAIEAQLAAEESNRLKDLFVAHVSHEMRSPLNAMMGYLQLLERESAGRERQRLHIARIQRSGQHVLEILNDLLDVSRLDAGRVRVALGPARIGTAIEAAVAETVDAAARNGIGFTSAVSSSEANLPYWGDEARVRQILVNLLTNAVKFTGNGGRVTVSAGRADRDPAGALSHPGPWVYV
jgi:PAS domain S-box-containing protein